MSTAADGGAGPRRADSPSRALVAGSAGAIALAAGAIVGWGVVRNGHLFHFDFSAAHSAALVAALAVTVVVVRWPGVGLALLVGVVYLDLSSNLIRFAGLPSILQLLVLPLGMAVVLDWKEDLLRGFAPRPLVLALGGYVLVVLLSTTVARDPALADARVAAVGKAFVLFLLVLLLARTPGRIRTAAWTLVGAGALVAGLALLQMATGDYGAPLLGLARVEYAQIYGSVFEPRIAGPVGDPNFFAQILVMVAPVSLLLAWREEGPWLRATAVAAASLVAVAAVFTYSRGGALALGVVVLLVVVALRPGPREILAGTVAVVIAVAVLPSDFTRRLTTLRQFLPGGDVVLDRDTSFGNRVLLARVAWNEFLDHPALGVGAGNYTVHYGEYAAEVGSTFHEYEDVGTRHYPHNLYLEIAAETGFAGVVAFGAAVLLCLGYLLRARRRFAAAGETLHAALATGVGIAIAGYLVSSIFLHGHFQRYLWLLFGLAAALYRTAPRGPGHGRAGAEAP